MPTLPEIVCEVLGIPPGELADDAGPGSYETWSSFGHIQLVVALEQHYGITFSSQEIGGMQSVRLIRDVLATKGVDT
jgi:acyl carrier protein